MHEYKWIIQTNVTQLNLNFVAYQIHTHSFTKYRMSNILSSYESNRGDMDMYKSSNGYRRSCFLELAKTNHISFKNVATPFHPAFEGGDGLSARQFVFPLAVKVLFGLSLVGIRSGVETFFWPANEGWKWPRSKIRTQSAFSPACVCIPMHKTTPLAFTKKNEGREWKKVSCKQCIECIVGTIPSICNEPSLKCIEKHEMRILCAPRDLLAEIHNPLYFDKRLKKIKTILPYISMFHHIWSTGSFSWLLG